jgi:hypothetical protein
VEALQGVKLTGTKWPCGLTMKFPPAVSYRALALETKPVRIVFDFRR